MCDLPREKGLGRCDYIRRYSGLPEWGPSVVTGVLVAGRWEGRISGVGSGGRDDVATSQGVLVPPDAGRGEEMNLPGASIGNQLQFSL